MSSSPFTAKVFKKARLSKLARRLAVLSHHSNMPDILSDLNYQDKSASPASRGVLIKRRRVGG